MEECQSGMSYRRVNNPLIPRIVVDIYRHAAQRGYLGAELVQARVVLPFALVGVGHGCGERASVRVRERLAVEVLRLCSGGDTVLCGMAVNRLEA